MIIGTRDSMLAMAQTDLFVRSMREHAPDICLEICSMKTSGDMDQTSDIRELEGYGAFVRELDAALADGRIDVSVNSMKDVPIMRNDSVAIPAVLPRAPTEDVILPVPLEDLPEGAAVGSSSARRTAELLDVRSDLVIRPLRGNVPTRLNKLDRGEYDAIVLAKAGLDRLGIIRDMHILDPARFVPAPAQGAIAIACRSDDHKTISVLKKLNHERTFIEVTAERQIMRMLGAGCSSPVGIHARLDGDIHIEAVSYASGVSLRSVRTIPKNYSEDDISEIANELGGIR